MSGPGRDELPRSIDDGRDHACGTVQNSPTPETRHWLLASMIDKVLAEPNILDEESCVLLDWPARQGRPPS